MDCEEGMKERLQVLLKDRVDLITAALWNTTAAPTNTFIKSYDDAASKFDDVLVFLKVYR